MDNLNYPHKAVVVTEYLRACACSLATNKTLRFLQAEEHIHFGNGLVFGFEKFLSMFK